MDDQGAVQDPTTPSSESTANVPEGSPAATVPLAAAPRRRWRWAAVAVAVAVALALVWARSDFGAHRPVDEAISADVRNAGVEISAKYGGYWNSSVLVLDLVKADGVAPSDLFRSLFQAAAVFHGKAKRFDRIELARAGKTVYLMDGSEFAMLGRQYATSENPLYLIRTLPAKLKEPSGSPAFSEWTGGWLGVMKAEVEDANKAAQHWRDGGL